MNADTEAAIRHIYEHWHETVVRRDIRGLMELYAEDAILETPLILATLKERTRRFYNTFARRAWTTSSSSWACSCSGTTTPGGTRDRGEPAMEVSQS